MGRLVEWLKALVAKFWKIVATDGLLHILMSALILITVFGFGLKVWWAALVTLAVGVAKEISDRYLGGYPSWHDIICDIVGIGIGTLITFLF